VLVVGLFGSIIAFGGIGPSDAPTATGDTPSTPSTAQASSPTFLISQPQLLGATVIPAQIDRPRPDLFPIVSIPDAIDAFGAYSADTDDLPRLTALVGRLDGDRLTGGIQIQTLPEFRPEWLPGNRAVEVIDGTDVGVYTQGGSPETTVVLPGEPLITVTGLDPVAFLRQSGPAIASATWSDGVGELSIDESVLPDGYEVVVEPALEPLRSLAANTTASLVDSDGPSATVQLRNPLPSLATGADPERVEVNGSAAWSAPTPGGHTIVWSISDTTWVSVRARGRADETLTLAESLDLAAGIQFTDESTWRSTYRVPEPIFASDEQIIGIDRGTSDDVSAGMLVYAGTRIIGQVADADESTSNVVLATAPEFSIDATLAPETGGLLPQGCRVRGGNDHVGFVCDGPFDERVRVGAGVTTLNGAGIGSITSIMKIGDEPVALLDVLDVNPIAGDPVTVLNPGS